MLKSGKGVEVVVDVIKEEQANSQSDQQTIFAVRLHTCKPRFVFTLGLVQLPCSLSPVCCSVYL